MDSLVQRQRDKEASTGSGFFKLPNWHTCTHPQHAFPTHLHIPQGEGYRHVCPECGQMQEVINYGNY